MHFLHAGALKDAEQHSLGVSSMPIRWRCCSLGYEKETIHRWRDFIKSATSVWTISRHLH